jgi:hypothetical protein
LNPHPVNDDDDEPLKDLRELISKDPAKARELMRGIEKKLPKVDPTE